MVTQTGTSAQTISSYALYLSLGYGSAPCWLRPNRSLDNRIGQGAPLVSVRRALRLAQLIGEQRQVNEAVGAIIPLSDVVKEMREKEARQGVTFAAAIAELRNLPFGGSMANVTAMARPTPVK